MKRILSILLVLSMVVGLFPILAMGVSAEEIEYGLMADLYQLNTKGDVFGYDQDAYYNDIIGSSTGEGELCSFDDTQRFASSIDQMLRVSKVHPEHSKTGLTAIVPPVGADRYFTKWEGTITATETGDYTFVGRKIDNGFAAYVDQNGNGEFEDNELFYDYWAFNHWFDDDGHRLVSNKGAFHLEEGEATAIQMWYYEAGGGEACSINVSTEGGANDKSFAEAGLAINVSQEVYVRNIAVNHNRINDVLPAGTNWSGATASGQNGAQANVVGNHKFDATITAVKNEMIKLNVEKVLLPGYEQSDIGGLTKYGFRYEDCLIEYEGYLTPAIGGTYQFGTKMVDNCFVMELQINGEWVRVYEFWAGKVWNDNGTTFYNAEVALEAGVSYPMRATYLEIDGGEGVKSVFKIGDTIYNSCEAAGIVFTTHAIEKTDVVAPTTSEFTVDGDISDWEGVKSISIVGSGEFEGKKATWYAVTRPEGVYIACDAYHGTYTARMGNDVAAWHENSNLEIFLGQSANTQYWVSAKSGTCASDNVAAYRMVNETVGGLQHTVTEVFISNDKLPDDCKAGNARMGIAWKTPGDKCNNGGNGAASDWWTAPKAKTNGMRASQCYVDAKGVSTPSEYLGVDYIAGNWTKVSDTQYDVKFQGFDTNFNYYQLGSASKATVSTKLIVGGQVGFMFGVEDLNGDGYITEGADTYYLISFATQDRKWRLERNDKKWGGWSSVSESAQVQNDGDEVVLKVEYDNGNIKVYVSDVLQYEFTDAAPFAGTGYGLCAKNDKTFNDVTAVEYETLSGESNEECDLYYQTRTVADNKTDYRIIAVASEELVATAGAEQALIVEGKFTDGNNVKSFKVKLNNAYSVIEAAASNGVVTEYTTDEGYVILGIVITGVPEGYKLDNTSVVAYIGE